MGKPRRSRSRVGLARAVLLLIPMVVVVQALSAREISASGALAALLAVALVASLEFALRRLRTIRRTPTILPADAIDAAVDESTCGHLLGTKRTIDPSGLIHRSAPAVGPVAEPKPLPYAHT